MRLNFKHENSVNKNTENLCRWIFSQVRNFGKEYDVSSNVLSHYVFTDEKISAEFCSWMSKQGLLNMKPYSLVCDDDVMLAQGYDITEDELLTMRILEIS